MEKVARDTGPLGFPVQPESTGAVVNVIPADHRIDGCMEFDPCDLIAAKVPIRVDVMDMVILDEGKSTAHVSHNSRLTAMVDMAVTDDVRSDGFFGPAFIYALAYRFPLCLGAVF